MSLNLLETLMAKAQTPTQEVKKAQEELKNENPVTEFMGVNAPEFTQDLAPELVEQVDEMEAAFEQQAEETVKKPISIPMHDDGLDDDDDEIELTDSHVQVESVQSVQENEEEETPVIPTKEDTWGDIEEPSEEFEESEESEEMSAVSQDEQVESNLWNEKPFSSRYFNFGGRTVNSLERAGYTCYNDIKGMAYSELLDIKGFGRNCLEEILELLEIEDVQGWLLKRKKKVKETETQEEVQETQEEVQETQEEVQETQEEVQETQEEVQETQEEVQESVTEPVEEAEVIYVAEEIEVVSQEAEEVVVEDTPEESNEVQEDSTPSVSSLKFLVIGNASPLSNNVKVASFEQVYAQAIQGICSASNVPSLGMVEYGKGWSALAATVRQNGWPANVDVLCVSKSFLSRFEILLELRTLADVVVEG